LTSDPQTQKQQVLDTLHQWQKETGGETATRTSAHELFSQWDAEAAQMTDEEREAEDSLWEDFQKGINDTRAELGMRRR
jgi:outer membrane phospholipase A